MEPVRSDVQCGGALERDSLKWKPVQAPVALLIFEASLFIRIR